MILTVEQQDIYSDCVYRAALAECRRIGYPLVGWADVMAGSFFRDDVFKGIMSQPFAVELLSEIAHRFLSDWEKSRTKGVDINDPRVYSIHRKGSTI